MACASDAPASPDGDIDAPSRTRPDAGLAAESGAGSVAVCPAGGTLRRTVAGCAAPAETPAALATALGTASAGSVVALAGLDVPSVPCAAVLVCTPKDAPALIFSDSPESPVADGVLYADTVAAGRYRIYVYHTNGGAALRKFPVVALNQGTAAATITITRRGLAAPSAAYVSVGKTVLGQWFETMTPRTVTVPPGARVLIDPALDALHAAKDELVHAIYDVAVDATVKLSVVSVLAAADAAAMTAGLTLLPRDAAHQRGTFADADVELSGATSEAGLRRLRLGGDEVDPILVGVDRTTGDAQRLLGNYGLSYRVSLGLPPGARAAISPRGGPWGGVGQAASGELLLLPAATAVLGTTNEAIALGASTDVRFLSAGGSNLAVDLLISVP